MKQWVICIGQHKPGAPMTRQAALLTVSTHLYCQVCRDFYCEKRRKVFFKIQEIFFFLQTCLHCAMTRINFFQMSWKNPQVVSKWENVGVRVYVLQRTAFIVCRCSVLPCCRITLRGPELRQSPRCSVSLHLNCEVCHTSTVVCLIWVLCFQLRQTWVLGNMLVTFLVTKEKKYSTLTSFEQRCVEGRLFYRKKDESNSKRFNKFNAFLNVIRTKTF